MGKTTNDLYYQNRRVIKILTVIDGISRFETRLKTIQEMKYITFENFQIAKNKRGMSLMLYI